MKKYLIIVLFLLFSRSVISSSDLDSIEYISKYKWMTAEKYIAIEVNAAKHGIHPALGAALINRESNGKSRARGAAGERGLGQPLTCHYSGNPDDLFVPMINLDVSFSYLARAKKKANGNIQDMLRLYNQGLYGKKDKYNNWKYVNDIMKDYADTINERFQNNT